LRALASKRRLPPTQIDGKQYIVIGVGGLLSTLSSAMTLLPLPSIDGFPRFN
jgi:hypothetical protein